MTPGTRPHRRIAGRVRASLPAPLPSERGGRVANALDLVRRGELDPEGLVRAARPRRAGRRRPLPGPARGRRPGLAAAVRPGSGRAAGEDASFAARADWLRGRNVKVAQALLSPEEARLRRRPAAQRLPPCHAALFPSSRPGRATPARLTRPGSPLNYQPYDPSDPSVFHRTLLRTYEGTLDCPELNGARGVEDVIAGHRGHGRFDPGLWFLALADGEPIGVLLLTESAESGDWETSYVGVVPEARRRGFGRELMLKALAEARAAGAASLTLSVDARNRPAWELYRGLGFEPLTGARSSSRSGEVSATGYTSSRRIAHRAIPAERDDDGRCRPPAVAAWLKRPPIAVGIAPGRV